MERTNRIEWIDALRGFAIVLVLLGHIPGIPDWLFKWIYAFHIPLFFVISGYLYNHEKWKELGFKNLVISKAKSYLLPFIVISISIFIIEIIKLPIFSNVIYWEEFSKYIFDYLKWILFQIDGDFCGSLIAGLWFLPTLFFSTLMLYFINDNKKKIIIFCVLSIIVIMLLQYYSIISIPWHLDVALFGTILMIFGNCIHQKKLIIILKNLVITLIILIFGNILIVLNTTVDLKKHIFGFLPISIVAAICISIFLFYLFNKYDIKNRVLILFGKHSIFIISVNFIINKLLLKLFELISLDAHWLIIFILEFIINIIFVLLVECIFKKSKSA